MADLERWADPRVAQEILRHADASGLAREERWAAEPGIAPELRSGNGRAPSGAVAAALARRSVGAELDEDAVTALFEARGADLGAVLAAADELRREVRRRGQLRRHAERQLHERLLLPLRLLRVLEGQAGRQPAREALRRPARGDRPPGEEAWDRGAVEICLQGGIHPAFTGETYLEICAAVKEALPDLHVHAFSALEVWQGAATLGSRWTTTSSGCATSGWPPRHGGGDPRRRGAPHALPGQGLDRPVAGGARRRPRVGLSLDDDDHVRLRRGPAQLGAAFLELREQQKRSGGFTEFVPPFVHMEAPIYLKGRRARPTFREAVLMHAVGRLALHPWITNVQASWVKLGVEGAQAALRAGRTTWAGR